VDYREGENVTYIYHGTVPTIDQLDAEVQRLLDEGVDLILAGSTPAARAAARVTAGTGVEVVFVPVTDPVGAGIVKSINQPGGNVTGITNGGSDSRRLEWLLKIDPDIKRVYVPYNSDDLSPLSALTETIAAAGKLGVQLELAPATTSEAMLEAIRVMPEDIDAIFILPDSLAISHLEEFVQATYERRLPMSAPTTSQVSGGALMSFGLGFFEGGKQAARLADQILKGTSPADLPVETGEFTLGINLITADAIGLKIPEDVLNQADFIIRPAE
jgi:putative ABC transport system substrate-binding protein